jgi:hypothetical protein
MSFNLHDITSMMQTLFSQFDYKDDPEMKELCLLSCVMQTLVHYAVESGNSPKRILECTKVHVENITKDMQQAVLEMEEFISE